MKRFLLAAVLVLACGAAAQAQSYGVILGFQPKSKTVDFQPGNAVPINGFALAEYHAEATATYVRITYERYSPSDQVNPDLIIIRQILVPQFTTKNLATIPTDTGGFTAVGGWKFKFRLEFSFDAVNWTVIDSKSSTVNCIDDMSA